MARTLRSGKHTRHRTRYCSRQMECSYLAVRIPDIRRHVPFIAFLSVSDQPLTIIHNHILSINKQVQTLSWLQVIMVGFYHVQLKNIPLFIELNVYWQSSLALSNCVGGRLGRGIQTQLAYMDPLIQFFAGLWITIYNNIFTFIPVQNNMLIFVIYLAITGNPSFGFNVCRLKKHSLMHCAPWHQMNHNKCQGY